VYKKLSLDYSYKVSDVQGGLK